MHQALPHRAAHGKGILACPHRLFDIEHEGAFFAKLFTHPGDKLRVLAAELVDILLCNGNSKALSQTVQTQIAFQILLLRDLSFPVAALSMQDEELRAQHSGRFKIPLVKFQPIFHTAQVFGKKQRSLKAGGKRMQGFHLRPRLLQARPEHPDKGRIQLAAGIDKKFKQPEIHGKQEIQRFFDLHRIQACG